MSSLAAHSFAPLQIDSRAASWRAARLALSASAPLFRPTTRARRAKRLVRNRGSCARPTLETCVGARADVRWRRRECVSLPACLHSRDDTRSWLVESKQTNTFALALELGEFNKQAGNSFSEHFPARPLALGVARGASERASERTNAKVILEGAFKANRRAKEGALMRLHSNKSLGSPG